MRDYLTPKEAAQKMGVKPFTIREWLRTGRLRGYRRGNRWLVKPEDLDALIIPAAPAGALTGATGEEPTA